MSEQKWTPEQALEQISKAHAKVNDLCTGRADWTMSVPVQKDDPDILIVDALGAAHPYVAACQGAPESIQPGAVRAMADVLEAFTHDGRLQTYEDREEFRAWASGALRLYHGSE